MKKIATNMVMVVALTLSAQISAETTTNSKGDAAKGEEIAAGVCAGCHNADGNSIIPTNPSLAGQHAEYITKQLNDFKSIDGKPPKRNSPVMASMVAALSAEDMKNLGAYYAKQKANPGKASDDAALIKAGKILYHGGNIENGVPACASCHGPTGVGIPPVYPNLAGQHAEYTQSQLGLFNSGERANDNGVMQKVLARMNAQEKRAVSEYISGLR